MEAVHKQKAEKIREKTINDQLEARRTKNKATRERKAGKRDEEGEEGQGRGGMSTFLGKNFCLVGEDMGTHLSSEIMVLMAVN